MTIWPTFAHPLVLLLLLPVPLLLVWWRRQGRSSLRFSSGDLLRGLPGGRTHWAQHGGWLLRGLGLAALIIALSGPRWPDPGSRIPTEGLALTLVLDVSRSMDNADFLWDNQLLSRLEGVKKIFRLFVAGGQTPDGQELAGRPQDLIGLVTFATRPETACPLTLDHGTLLKILDEVQPRTLITEAATNPGDALAWALVSLHKAPTRRKVILFLTDGEANVPPPALHPRQAAQLAGNLGIPIYVIDANPESPGEEGVKEEGRPDSLQDNLQAQKILQDVAAITKGQYFQASSARTLGEVSAAIDRLERSRIETFQYSRYHEGFAWFSVSALALWLSVVFLEATVWRRCP